LLPLPYVEALMIYNTKRGSKLYIVYNGLRYLLDIYPDLSFSQTFDETAVQVKTLHNQSNMFELASITKANPANFSFTIPLMKEADLKIAHQLLVDYDSTSKEVVVKTCDIYVVSDSQTFKLEKCVFENGIYQISRNQIITLSLSGTAKKLSEFTGALPGALQSRTSTRTYTAPYVLEVTLDNVVQSNITTISLEVQNKITWVEYPTLHKSLVVGDASGTIFPEAFVVGSRVLSGSLQQYLTDTNTANMNKWKTGSALRVRTGNGGGDWILDVNIPSVVYTNRVEVGEFYLQNYDFRMTHNPTSLSSIINYITV
jgi:hypothetical protein